MLTKGQALAKYLLTPAEFRRLVRKRKIATISKRMPGGGVGVYYDESDLQREAERNPDYDPDTPVRQQLGLAFITALLTSLFAAVFPATTRGVEPEKKPQNVRENERPSYNVPRELFENEGQATRYRIRDWDALSKRLNVSSEALSAQLQGVVGAERAREIKAGDPVAPKEFFGVFSLFSTLSAKANLLGNPGTMASPFLLTPATLAVALSSEGVLERA